MAKKITDNRNDEGVYLPTAGMAYGNTPTPEQKQRKKERLAWQSKFKAWYLK